jgi:hypothetical protein
MCLPLKPFKVEREWKHAGLSCAVVQGREGGNRCGYVRVPPGHQFHGKDYNDPNVKVHGGLTFGALEPCTEHEDGQGYWFGFDCAHCYDKSYDPDMKPEDCITEEGRKLLQIYQDMDGRYPMSEPEHFWTLPEVVAETERLAEQFAAEIKSCEVL